MSLARNLVGLIVAPPAGSLLFELGAQMLRPSSADSSLFPLALYFTYVIALVFGVPAILLFRFFRLRRWWQFAMAGALLGPVAILVVQYNPNASSPLPMETTQFFACATLGLVCAVIYWAVAVFRARTAHAA